MLVPECIGAEIVWCKTFLASAGLKTMDNILKDFKTRFVEDYISEITDCRDKICISKKNNNKKKKHFFLQLEKKTRNYWRNFDVNGFNGNL